MLFVETVFVIVIQIIMAIPTPAVDRNVSPTQIARETKLAYLTDVKILAKTLVVKELFVTLSIISLLALVQKELRAIPSSSVLRLEVIYWTSSSFQNDLVFHSTFP